MFPPPMFAVLPLQSKTAKIFTKFLLFVSSRYYLLGLEQEFSLKSTKMWMYPEYEMLLGWILILWHWQRIRNCAHCFSQQCVYTYTLYNVECAVIYNVTMSKFFRVELGEWIGSNSGVVEYGYWLYPLPMSCHMWSYGNSVDSHTVKIRDLSHLTQRKILTEWESTEFPWFHMGYTWRFAAASASFLLCKYLSKAPKVVH